MNMITEKTRAAAIEIFNAALAAGDDEKLFVAALALGQINRTLGAKGADDD